MKAKSIFLVSFVLSGCAADEDSQFIDGFRPPAPNADEIQVVAPAVHDIAPGADITLCSYIDERVASDTDIIRYQGFQTAAGGHHTILYAVTRPQAANTHECNEDDMVNARYLAGAGADTPPAILPEGVVFRIPGNTQLMIQTHWINASDESINGQAAFNLKVTPATAEHKTAQLFTVATTSFVLPTGTGSTSADCTNERTMNVFMLGGHMHEWGTHTKITHTAAAAATPTTIYETDWNEHYVFNTPLNMYPVDKPFVLSPGDKLHIDCDYNNTTGAPLPFPSEMCVAFTYAYPMDKQLDCVDGHFPRD